MKKIVPRRSIKKRLNELYIVNEDIKDYPFEGANLSVHKTISHRIKRLEKLLAH